ncbi:RNA polymerase sigma factor (sigma-70 family) [Catalinimonas alkaloidigena]|uniref:RNA polymerase sigma factor n=1 Tax=Catalinimonas alkaloidigena TaxID=1075417 RepID=UPI0024058D6F|nr:sigma-70 family RNA polymerase sigma factor [Catalinimonas alkaloidigena]MDF9796885.1 RNA polymerase sigma factor (sigma-70 family) [Catalinimonas alkaloidigena]
MNIQSFKSAVFPIQGKLYRLAKMMLGNDEEAEDAVQEVLLKLWLNRQNLKNYRSIEALAMIITKNQCLDKLKSAHWRKSEVGEPPDTTHSWDSPYKTTELNDSKEILIKLMHELPEQQKLIMHLRDIEEYSYEEIEKITGLCINNIRVSLSRARKSIREQFTKVNAYGSAGN